MKLQKLNSTHWHEEAVKLLKDNFQQIHLAFTDATKRAVWMGMFLNYIKQKGKEDGTIKHGEFGPWLEKNVPEISRDTVTTYMKLAVGVCEKGKFEITEFPQFAELGHLPPKIKQMIEGKTQQQLMFSFGGGKAEAVEAGPRKKLSATELHEEHVKNIEATFEAFIASAMRLIQMSDVDFVLPKIAIQRADAIALRFREKVKRLQKEKARV